VNRRDDNVEFGKQFIVVAISGRQYPGELVALALP